MVKMGSKKFGRVSQKLYLKKGPKNVALYRQGLHFSHHGFFPTMHGRTCRHDIYSAL